MLLFSALKNMISSVDGYVMQLQTSQKGSIILVYAEIRHLMLTKQEPRIPLRLKNLSSPFAIWLNPVKNRLGALLNMVLFINNTSKTKGFYEDFPPEKC